MIAWIKDELTLIIAVLITAAISLCIGIVGTLFWQHEHRAVVVAQTQTKAVTKAATISNTVEKGLIHADAKITAAVARAQDRLVMVPMPVVTIAHDDPKTICETGDPDALWRAFADGYNSVLDAGGTPDDSAIGAGQQQASAPGP